MKLTFVNQSKTPLPRKYLSEWVTFVEKQLRRKKIGKDFYKKELIIVMLESAEAKKLNKQFRGKNYATDVLSFEGMEPNSLGELIFCAPVLKRQAKEHDLSFRKEFAYLLLHGLLHLLGYEHEGDERAAKKMYALQDDIFKSLDG